MGIHETTQYYGMNGDKTSKQKRAPNSRMVKRRSFNYSPPSLREFVDWHLRPKKRNLGALTSPQGQLSRGMKTSQEEVYTQMTLGCLTSSLKHHKGPGRSGPAGWGRRRSLPLLLIVVVIFLLLILLLGPGPNPGPWRKPKCFL